MEVKFNTEYLDNINAIGKELALALKSWNLPNWTFEETYAIVSKYGWYLPPFAEISLAFSIMKLYEADNIVEAEKTMVKYFKKNIKEIESELITLHPTKAEILKEAFLAHKRKMFYSSTILFLSQADGICDSIIFTASKLSKFKSKESVHPKFYQQLIL